MGNDIPALHRHLASLTEHFFDMDNPLEYGAFLNLVQHHGYPTPLLDWTYSPFVAAFFAFSNLKHEEILEDPNGFVRIFIFDKTTWTELLPQVRSLQSFGPNLSVLDFVAIGNDRLIPQQSISTVTGFDDIETYIAFQQRLLGRIFLRVVDLPKTLVMRELASMGISSASMFPGLDGACASFKERFF